MTISKAEWREFCDGLKTANGFEARELLFRGPRFDSAHRTNFGDFAEGDWPLMLPGAGARREFVLRERRKE